MIKHTHACFCLLRALAKEQACLLCSNDGPTNHYLVNLYAFLTFSRTCATAQLRQTYYRSNRPEHLMNEAFAMKHITWTAQYQAHFEKYNSWINNLCKATKHAQNTSHQLEWKNVPPHKVAWRINPHPFWNIARLGSCYWAWEIEAGVSELWHVFCFLTHAGLTYEWWPLMVGRPGGGHKSSNFYGKYY